MNGLASRVLSNTDYEDDNTQFLDNLFISRGKCFSSASIQKSRCWNRRCCSYSHCWSSPSGGLDQVWQTVVRHLLCDIDCDECKTCLIFPVMLVTNAFIYFKEYEEDKQFLTCPFWDTGRDCKCFCKYAGVLRLWRLFILVNLKGRSHLTLRGQLILNGLVCLVICCTAKNWQMVGWEGSQELLFDCGASEQTGLWVKQVSRGLWRGRWQPSHTSKSPW